ncbi:MAG: DNA-processing protein DprA [Bacteroidota bacterium]
MHPDTFSRVALSRVPFVGPKLFRILIQHFGEAAEVFRARPQELCEVVGIAERIAAGFAATNPRPQQEAEAILTHAEHHRLKIFCCLDDDYPTRLHPYTSAAPILYYAGEADLDNPRTTAIVGTREMSSQGARQVDRLLDPLADYSPLIISGLAYGVDIYAHRRCLQVGLPTLAVMGSGFDRVYPQAHSKTARQITENGGGVLTAYPYWMKPDKEHFPARNRIVAMLADLTVVVESATRGGSMITADLAHDLGRKVGACPGRAADLLTGGCNALIKSGRAHLIESAQ